MPTPEEIAALEYSGASPGGQGLTADDYRTQYRAHAKAFRWWQGWQIPEGASGPNGEVRHINGRVYIEQIVPEEARVYTYQTKRDTETPEWGLVERGATGLSTVPAWAEFANGDLIALLDVTWIGRQIITRGANAFGVADTADELARLPVQSITKVLVNNALVDKANYEVVPRGIVWLSFAPAVGTKYFVQYRYCPIWEWQIDENAVMQRGIDGEALPQRGVVRVFPATGDKVVLF